MNYQIETTELFDRWLAKLKNRPTRYRVAERLARVEMGKFGNHKQLGEGLFELRFTFAAGLRIYCTLCNGKVVLLLVDGDNSMQSKDISRSRSILEELE
jgi:putative addiction module killer protein